MAASRFWVAHEPRTALFIVTDTFRIEDGRLAEHWDALQPIDFGTRLLFLVTGGAIANSNPTF